VSASTLATPAIALQNVSEQFGAQRALADIDLTIGHGQFVSIVGESGCGKTTLLRLIAGLLAPTSGSVAIEGTAVKGPQRGVSFVFQTPVLLRWRTALENVLLPTQVADTRLTPQLHQRAIALMERAGLGEALGKLPHELSGGMQSRVALARALLLEPAILLLDEPFAALDAITRERMGLALLELWLGSGMTALFVTHDIAEAVFLSDVVILMAPRPGRIVRSFPVPLPRPRTLAMRFEPEFIALCHAIRMAMERVEHDQGEAAR